MTNLQNLIPAKVECVYSGHSNKCRCGCAGTYRFHSANVAESSKRRGYAVEHNEVNDRQVAKVLALLQHHDRFFPVDRGDGLDSSNYFDVQLGGRAYTAYTL